jgi:FMN phosphatase YigB (HAD superfamily)
VSLKFGLRGSNRNMADTSYGLLTLDVFDTCVIRDFVSQESLWCALGHRFIGLLPGVSNAADFARLRGVAEESSRQVSEREDVSLAEVYERLAASYGWNTVEQGRAMRLEEELEASGLHVNPAVRSFINGIGHIPVCYLTDTPHRGAFIEQCLGKQDLPTGTVLSSGDLGLRKGTGSLFREAMSRFGQPPAEVFHVGNNLQADGTGSGIAGAAFGPLLQANPNRYERILDAPTACSVGLLGPCLAGAGRACRLEAAGQFPPGLLSVVTGVAGPAILAATAWALLSAQADGIQTLYFVSRDGEILLSAAEVLRREIGIAPGVECRYLYGSRRAWHLPALSLKQGDHFVPALRALLKQSGKATLRELLAQLDLSDEEMDAVGADVAPEIPLDAQLKDSHAAVIDALAASGPFQSLASSKAAGAFEATVGYLRQEGMFDRGRAGLVDLGWLGHAAASLVAVAADQGANVRCYFAGGLCGRGSEHAPRESRAFLIDARGDEPKLRPALVHLLETFCAGSGSSTIGYAKLNGQYVPRFAADDGATSRWGLGEYQALVRRYVEAAAQAAAKAGWTITLEELAALRPVLIKSLTTLWHYPTYEEAEVWGRFPFEGLSGPPAMLGRALTLGDVFGYLMHPTAAERPQSGPWRQAAMVRTVGGRWFTDPYGWTHVLSPAKRQAQLARVRAQITRKPPIPLATVAAEEDRLVVHRRPSS